MSVIEAERIGRLVHLHVVRSGTVTGDDHAVVTETAAVLTATAAMLRTLPPATPTAPDLAALEDARTRQRAPHSVRPRGPRPPRVIPTMPCW